MGEVTRKPLPFYYREYYLHNMDWNCQLQGITIFAMRSIFPLFAIRSKDLFHTKKSFCVLPQLAALRGRIYTFPMKILSGVIYAPIRCFLIHSNDSYIWVPTLAPIFIKHWKGFHLPMRKAELRTVNTTSLFHYTRTTTSS